MKYIEIMKSIDFDVTIRDTEALAYLALCLEIHFSSVTMKIQFVVVIEIQIDIWLMFVQVSICRIISLWWQQTITWTNVDLSFIYEQFHKNCSWT